jgi:hypothetical protein
MPGFDRTGPGGTGPMTGGGRGFCGDPGRAGGRLAGGRAFFGRCGGRGWRNVFHATGLPRWKRWSLWNVQANDEKQTLKGEVDFLKSRLHALEERLGALNTESK